MATRKKTAPATRPSEPEAVEQYLRALKHPLKDVVVALRAQILAIDATLGEEIAWNAPAFFFTGAMQPFDAKTYKRHVVVFNLHKQDCVRLIFLDGARVKDTSGLLEGAYADGRRIANYHGMDDVDARAPALRKVIMTWLKTLER